MSRSLPEWRGKHDDSPVPPRVRLRIFERHAGICYLSGRKIRPGEDWDLDHIVAIINGGSNSELNLAPVLIDPHKVKTKEDVAEKSRVARKRKSFLGIKKKRTITRWRRFDGTIVTATKDRS